MKKLKITKKFLLDIKLADEKIMTSLRINKTLLDFALSYAEQQGWGKADYLDRLILAHAVYESKGKDLFSILDDN